MIPIETGYLLPKGERESRPLSQGEAQAAFDRLSRLGDRIAFRYLHEGCECRAQLMIEELLQDQINPGRAWTLSLGRKLTVLDPFVPKQKIVWENHVAPFVLVEGHPWVIDPSMSSTGPLPIPQWVAAMRIRCFEISFVPLTQAQILDRQSSRVLAGEDPLEAIAIVVAREEPPLPDVGGSGFRIGADPPEGPAAFSRRLMERYLALLSQLESGQP